MAQISVTPEELTSQANVYLQAKENIEQAIQQVNAMNSAIASEWKGQAFNAYLNQYQELYTYVQKYEELLVQINQQLVRYANTMAERDAADAGSFGF